MFLSLFLSKNQRLRVEQEMDAVRIFMGDGYLCWHDDDFRLNKAELLNLAEIIEKKCQAIDEEDSDG